jgi:glycosyltransferase involved in cell wall biosynthesis
MAQLVRVLVIPSWYPSTVNPLAGSHFQEQARLLQQRYDVRVLFGISRRVGYRSALMQYHWFRNRGFAKVRPLRADTIPNTPPAIGFAYAHRSNKDSTLLDAAIDAYREMLNRLITEGWKPNILHAHCAEFAGIITSRLSQEFGIPWVLTEHQVFALAYYSEHRRRLMVDALLSATKLVAVSNHQLRCIALQNIYRPIVVMGNLIDEEVFRFAEPRRDQTRFRILTVTYPSPIKDCETYFRAIALLLERGHSDIVVTVIGNNSFHDLSRANTDEYERLAAKFGVEQVCRFIAYVARSEMPKYYAECDVFVSTSIAETFGIAVREAMAVGRPAVCTASGGVEDDLSLVNGVKVNVGDYEAVADALIAVKTGRLNFDPVKVRNSVVDKHGRQAFLDQMAAIYEDVVADNQVRTASV